MSNGTDYAQLFNEKDGAAMAKEWAQAVKRCRTEGKKLYDEVYRVLDAVKAVDTDSSDEEANAAVWKELYTLEEDASLFSICVVSSLVENRALTDQVLGALDSSDNTPDERVERLMDATNDIGKAVNDPDASLIRSFSGIFSVFAVGLFMMPFAMGSLMMEREEAEVAHLPPKEAKEAMEWTRLLSTCEPEITSFLKIIHAGPSSDSSADVALFDNAAGNANQTMFKCFLSTADPQGWKAHTDELAAQNMDMFDDNAPFPVSPGSKAAAAALTHLLFH